MKTRYDLIIISTVVLIFIVAFFGETIDKFAGKVLKFMLFLPPIVAIPLSIVVFAITGTWAVVRSSKNHWPENVEYQNDDKNECNHD